MLSSEVVRVCMNSYTQHTELDTKANYLLSPLFTPDYMLRQYPPTTIYIAELDMLKDNALRMVSRLL